MVATEKYIDSENSNVIEIERDNDAGIYISIAFNKECYMKGDFLFNGVVFYESENVFKYLDRSGLKPKVITISKSKLLGYASSKKQEPYKR